MRSVFSPFYIWAVLGPALVMSVPGCSHRPTPVAVPEQAPVGIMVMAHGGTAEWNATVEDAVAPLRERAPVAIAFGMADPASLQRGVSDLEARGVSRIVVIRLFISGHSFLHATEFFLGLRPDPPSHLLDRHERSALRAIRRSAEIVLTPLGLVDDTADVGTIVTERVMTLSVTPERESVLILAHGMGSEALNDELVLRLEQLAHRVRRHAAFRAVAVETLREDWDDKRVEATRRIRHFVERGNQHDGRVIVVPFRLSGFGPYRDVLEGLPYVADGVGLLPHPLVTRWMERATTRSVIRAGWPDPFSPASSSRP